MYNYNKKEGTEGYMRVFRQRRRILRVRYGRKRYVGRKHNRYIRNIIGSITMPSLIVLMSMRD